MTKIRRTHVAQYYAEDKDIFDILMSSKRRFDAEALCELARRRGIVLSEDTDREVLADYLARLVWSWPELQHLLDLAETPERREKITGSRFVTDAPVDEVKAVVEDVKAVREARTDETLTVKKTEKGIAVTVRYSEFDSSRTRLQQRVDREVTLEIERGETGYSVRHQANDRARDIAKEIVAKLEEKRGGKFDAAEITLKGIAAPELRTQFFVNLMTKMAGYKLRNVTTVSVDRAVQEEDEEEVSDDDEPGDSATDEPGDSATDEAATMLGAVKKAVFEGQSLLSTKEFQSLKEEGFFLSRAVWRSAEERADGIEVEFEADFEDAKNCTGFRYNIRGVYERQKRGEEKGIKKTRTACPPERRGEFLRAVEDAAQTALAEVESEATGEEKAGPGEPAEGD